MTSVSAATHADLYHRTGSGRLQLVATFTVAFPDQCAKLVASIRRASAMPRWHERPGSTAILQQGPFRPSTEGDAVVLWGAGSPEAFLLGQVGCVPLPLETLEKMLVPADAYVVEKVSGFGGSCVVATAYVTATDGTIQVFGALAEARCLAEHLNAEADGATFFRPVMQPEW